MKRNLKGVLFQFMKWGYVRVSTVNQDETRQVEALLNAGVKKRKYSHRKNAVVRTLKDHFIQNL